MIEQEKQTFAKILGSVALLCSAEINEHMIEAYWKYLKNKFDDIKEFSRAADRVVENWKIVNTFPPASMFIEHKIDKTNIEIIAQKAWDSVLEALKQGVGYNKIAEFEDKLIPAVVKFYGGFERLASKTFEELEWTKKEFIKTYKAAMQGEINLEEKDITAQLEYTPTVKIAANYPLLNEKVVPVIEDKSREVLNKVGLEVKRMA